MIKLFWNISAVRSIISFFNNDANNLISSRGYEILADPKLKAIYEKELQAYIKEGKHGLLIIDFKKKQI